MGTEPTYKLAARNCSLKDMITVTPGAVLLNIVPRNEPLIAEVAIKNEGMVQIVGANDPQRANAQAQSPQSYKALLHLQTQELASASGEKLKLTPGMVVQAEIHQGRRSVLEYLLSPVQKVAQEAARER